MELFPACLTSPPAPVSYGKDQGLGLLVYNLMLVHRPRKHSLSPGNISHHRGPVAFFYIPYECSGSLCRCCDGSGMSVGLQIVLLLLGHSLVGVFLSGLSHILLAMLVYFVRCPGLVVAGFQLGSHLASLHLVHPGVIKQGLCFRQICKKLLWNTSRPLCLLVILDWKRFVDIRVEVWCFNLYYVTSIHVLAGVGKLLLYLGKFIIYVIYMGAECHGVCLL